MASVKYLVTVDSETGVPTKFELVGESGELTDLDLNKLSWECNHGGTGGISLVINIYGGASVSPHGAVRLSESGETLFRFPSPKPGLPTRGAQQPPTPGVK
jgi:hypothetical protein